MAKRKHERFNMFTACERCTAARHDSGFRRVHFNLDNPYLRKWIRFSQGIFRPPRSFFGTSESDLPKDVPRRIVFVAIDAHDYAVLHCKKPNHLAILFKFPVKITINII